MKQKLLFLLAALAFLLPARLSAYDFEYTYEGITLKYDVIDKDAKTCKVSGYASEGRERLSGALVIPDVANYGTTDYSVTSIGESVFYLCSRLKSVVIPNSVTEIGSSAFYGCSGLKSLEIPNSVQTIGSSAFMSCKGLTPSVVIPDAVTSIGEYTFSSCSSLTSMKIPKSVTSIGKAAFLGCSGLTTLEIPNSITLIDEATFKGCSGLTTLEIPNSITSIGKSAFEGCSGLTTLEIPNSVTSIGNGAFEGCSGLSSVVIPDSVTSIGSWAFIDCIGLTSVAIGSAVTSIGARVFEGCNNLISLTFNAENCTECGNMAFTAFPSSLKTVEIGDRVTNIPNYAFCGCSSLTSVVIPNSVTSIGESAFAGCSGLTTLEIPNSVTSIGVEALKKCSGLTSLVIGNSVQTIGEWCFSGCTGLLSIVIPSSVTSIGAQAFWGCSGLIKSAYPNTLKNPFDKGTAVAYNPDGAIIEDGWIWGPEKSEIRFAPSSLKGCDIIPETVTSIAEMAYAWCIGLTSVVITNPDISIADNAFYECSRLRKSAYPDTMENPFNNGIISIPYNYSGAIFDDGWIYGPEKSEILFAPTNLEGEYVIPEFVTSIGSSAFCGCSSLTTIKLLTEMPVDMKDNSFEDLYDTVNLTVPDESVNNYLATNWSLFKNIQNNSGKELGYFSDGVFEYRLNPTDMTAMVIGAKSYSDLLIPERFTDDSDAANPVRYYIKGIGYKAFDGKGVNSVEFNSRSRMEYIGDYAFANTSFSSITLPETMKNIGEYAFYKASNLSEVKLNEGLASIGEAAFAETKISSITVPESVSTIGDYAFYNTKNLSKIELKEGLESIGSYAFGAEKERSVTGKPLYLPSTVKSVGMHTFKNFVCSQVDISDLSAWYGIDFGSYLANPLCGTGNGLYVDGKKLTSLKVPEGIKEIKPYAFYNCKSLEEVTFPEGLEKIGTNSFRRCENITVLTIPASVVEIEKYVFGQSKVTFADGLLPISFGEGAFYNSNGLTDLNWGRPLESLTLNIDNVTSLEIGNLITEIPDGKFKDLKKLKSLSLGSSIRTIGDNAFSGCTSLAEVILPPYVETIGASAFAGDSNLADIVMGHSVKTIGEKAFDGCKANTVSITAQTPPTAPNNTFSNYKGMLYLQGQASLDAYYDVFTCWDRFESTVMTEPTGIEMKVVDNISGKPGDTFQLTAKLIPENVTLPQIFWRSTNPDVATVDANGLVTLHADNVEMATRATVMSSCKIIVESLYADGPVAEVTLTGEVDEPILVESLTIDPTAWSGVEGSEFTIKATVLPENAEDKTLTFESSDNSIATVDAEGNVKVLKEGTCVITVSTVDGSSLKTECVVTGLSGVEAIFSDPNALVDVYDMNSVMMKKGCSREELKQLKPAVYILRSGDTVVKTIVK